MTADRGVLATHLLDQVDGAMAELGHWLDTGERVECPRCTQTVPATASGGPVRHQLRGQWCEGSACCDSHNIHCEPPSELCCHDCPEAAHDTFPIRHADGSRCVMEKPEGRRDEWRT